MLSVCAAACRMGLISLPFGHCGTKSSLKPMDQPSSTKPTVSQSISAQDHFQNCTTTAAQHRCTCPFLGSRETCVCVCLPPGAEGCRLIVRGRSRQLMLLRPGSGRSLSSNGRCVPPFTHRWHVLLFDRFMYDRSFCTGFTELS